MKKKTTPAADSQVKSFASFKPCLTLAEVTANFVAKEKKKQTRDGDNNSCLMDFKSLATMLCENYRTFSFNDVLSLSRSLDLSAEALAPLFHAWIAELKESKRVKALASCYDFPCYTFC